MMMKRALLLSVLIGLCVACGGDSPSEPIQAGDTKDYTVEGRVTQADDPSVGIAGVSLLISTNVLGEFVSTETDAEGYYGISFRRRCTAPGIAVQFITPAAIPYEGTSITIPCEPLVQALNISLEPS